MIAVSEEPVQRLRLGLVPWSSHDAILHAFDGKHLRITYDRGELEMPIYAALRVPEVWRYDHSGLTVHHLGRGGKYKVKTHSHAFPFLPMDDIRRFLNEAETMDDADWLRAFHDWARDTVLPLDTAAAAKKKPSGKKPRV
jgi:hypothetical protein